MENLNKRPVCKTTTSSAKRLTNPTLSRDGKTSMQYTCNSTDSDLTVALDGYCVILYEPVSSEGCLNVGDSISRLVRNC